MKDNKQYLDFIIGRLKVQLMELEFKTSSNNEQIEDFEKGIKEKNEQNELIHKEMLIIKHCINLLREYY